MTVTIRDVAKAADVSPKTISRVLNNERWVQAETRDKVLRAIKELDFHPNPIARGLATNQMATLGVVVPDLANPFFAKAIDSCAEQAERNGYGLSIATSRDDPGREASQVQGFLAHRVSGLILWNTGIDAAALRQMMDRFRCNCPTVFINSQSRAVPLDPAPFESILISEERVGALATQHLLNEGRRHIAFIGVRGSGHWISQQRLTGYRNTLLGSDITPKPEWLRYALHATIREGFVAASTLFAQRSRPDAVFAVNDLLAVGAQLACREAGERVPEDVAIVGVDDTEIAVVAQPPLTSIRLHQREIGQRAADLVLSLIRPAVPGSPAMSELPLPDLIVRGSSSLRAAPVTSHDDIDSLQ